MLEIVGDLWAAHADGKWVAITTNGDVNRYGHAVMGRGCALEAKQRYPELPQRLGRALLDHRSPNEDGNDVYPFDDLRLLSFPTKYHPYHRSDILLIQRSAQQLMRLLRLREQDTTHNGIVFPAIRCVVLPRPGCKNGGLQWEVVSQVIRPILDDRVHVICRPEEAFIA